MPKISTYYDKELKEKCFVVRGDEAYARTTDVAIALDGEPTATSSIYTYSASIALDVYRDIGDSTVLLYDNDELIDTIEWSDDVSSQTIDLTLTYADMHRIRAKYLGNSSCRASQSKVLDIQKERDASLTSSITPNALESKVYYDDFSLHFTLDTPSGVTGARTVTVYVDDTEYTTVDATPNTSTAVSFTGLTDALHTIKYVFDGDDVVSSCENSVQISYGLNIKVSTPSIVAFDNADFTYSITVYDFFGNVINSNFLCGLDIPYGISYTGATQSVTLTNGTFTLPTTSLTSITGESGTFLIGGQIELRNFNIPVNAVEVQDITLDADYKQLQDNETTTLRGSVSTNGSVEGLKVLVDGETVVTDSYGDFTKPYSMESLYDDMVGAYCGGITESITIENVLQYWEIGDGIHETEKLYNTTRVNVRKTNIGYEVKSSSSSQPTGRIVFRPVYDENVVMTFRVRGQSNSPANKFMGEYSMSNCPVGNTFKCIKTGTTYKLYVNDVLKKTITNSDYTHLLLAVGQNGSVSSLTFSTMKIKRYQA